MTIEPPDQYFYGTGPTVTPNPLAKVKRAAASKRRADLNYGLALTEAVNAGHSYADIARALNVSRQAVRQLIERKETNTQ